ncbi:MAG: hypothetical protein ACRD3G_07370 [Vicinamibacterales bacterium]
MQKAIERDDVPIARRLIELGADLDGPRENRLPPLVSALSAGMVNLLLKAGADPHERPVGKVGADAACRGNWRVVRVLLNAGADPLGGSSVQSALDCARRARADESNRPRTVLDRGRPTIADFDQIMAQLEAAEKRKP